MIDNTWKRLAAFHVQDEGKIGAIWLAMDPTLDQMHLYDACVFEREVLAVIAEGFNCRGRWIPVAFREKDKDTANK